MLQNLVDDGWISLFEKEKSFYQRSNINLPNCGSTYIERGVCARHQNDQFIIEHYYQIDIFYATIDFQMQELKSRLNE